MVSSNVLYCTVERRWCTEGVAARWRAHSRLTRSRVHDVHHLFVGIGTSEGTLKKREKERKRQGETLIGQLEKEVVRSAAECPCPPLGALPSTVCGDEKETTF